VENEDLKKRVAYLTAQLAALDHSFPVPHESGVKAAPAAAPAVVPRESGYMPVRERVRERGCVCV
jgi:hypothetical protein